MPEGNRPMLRQPGQVTHGAYAVERRIRGDEVDKRTRLGRRVHSLRLGFVLALGYPTWMSTPAPLREAIRNAVRLALFNERLFSPFWAGGEVPRAFLTASENLRRALGDLGLEPKAAGRGLTDYLASRYGARTSDPSGETEQSRSGGV